MTLPSYVEWRHNHCFTDERAGVHMETQKRQPERQKEIQTLESPRLPQTYKRGLKSLFIKSFPVPGTPLSASWRKQDAVPASHTFVSVTTKITAPLLTEEQTSQRAWQKPTELMEKELSRKCTGAKKKKTNKHTSLRFSIHRISLEGQIETDATGCSRAGPWVDESQRQIKASPSTLFSALWTLNHNCITNFLSPNECEF